VPTLPIVGLDDSHARALLVESVRGLLDSAVGDRIIAECHGNPLALLELPRSWSLDLAGGFGFPDTSPVADKIEQSYARRSLLLPADTQRLLLIAAAEPLGDVGLLRTAARSLGIDMSSADAAAEAGLLHVGARVAFAHPLVRSAIYHSAPAEDRQLIHRALAEVTSTDSDPDRRAWHRAHATALPDEDVAAELARSADRARARGGAAATAAFLTRATELTPDPTMRSGRAIEAAFAHLEAGAFEAAGAMADLAERGPVD
jgi:hypothetical protein